VLSKTRQDMPCCRAAGCRSRRAGRAAMLEPHDGVLFMGLLAPCGASGALASAGPDPRLGLNRLPRCSVFKDRVPRGHLFSVVCLVPTVS
jgi:hypothetical protein